MINTALNNYSLDDIIPMAEGLLATEGDIIANMANLSSLLFEALPQVNWVGFYRLIGHELVLGPFQGRIACTRIAVGKGVCGTAAEQCKVQRVADVHEFPGHIACDGQSQSEIVLPIFYQGALYGVLDIDSPIKARFSEEDQKLLEKIIHLFEKSL